MIEINKELVSKLIKSQFPQWSELQVNPVKKSGNDNRTFHLGTDMSVRLPSQECYVPQVEKEMFWLPKLKPHVTLPISAPIAQGEPCEGYPWPWSVNKWIDGETLSYENVSNLDQLAMDLAGFLKKLQAVDSTGGKLDDIYEFIEKLIDDKQEEEDRVKTFDILKKVLLEGLD